MWKVEDCGALSCKRRMRDWDELRLNHTSPTSFLPFGEQAPSISLTSSFNALRQPLFHDLPTHELQLIRPHWHYPAVAFLAKLAEKNHPCIDIPFGSTTVCAGSHLLFDTLTHWKDTTMKSNLELINECDR